MTDQELAQTVWDYMRYEQPPEEVDIIIGLGCHDIGVARYSANLYLQGFAPLIMFCGANGRMTSGKIAYEADWFAEEAIRLGVPDEAILRERNSTNTGENITYAHQLLEAKGLNPKKIIITHAPYMLRRDYAAVMKQWPGKTIPKFIFSAEQVTMNRYIERLGSLEETLDNMLGDLQRIREYPKLGFQIEQDIPEDVWAAYEELVKRGYAKQLI